MKLVLGREGRAALRQCAQHAGLLAFDFDGTLAPIVGEPRQAALRAQTRQLLARLAPRQPLLVLSGRSPEDLAERLGGIGSIQIVGNHGASFDLSAGERKVALARASRWRAQLTHQLSGRKDIWIEDNGVSLALHYRGSHDRAAAIGAIRQAVATLNGACELDGRDVVNVLPASFTHKGAVLRTIVRRSRRSHVLYAGDDITDEAAFRTAAAPHYVTVRVGCSSTTAADYCLRDQSEMNKVLAFLVQCDS